MAFRFLSRCLVIAPLMLGLGLSPRAQTTAPVASDAAESTDVRAALAEMAELEEQLARQQREDDAQRRALDETSRSLERLGTGLSEQQSLSEEGAAALAVAGERLAAKINELETAQRRDREALDATRANIRETAAALLWQSEPGQPIQPETQAVLASRLARRRDDAAILTRRIMLAEQELADLRSNREYTQTAARYHSSFTELKRAQLQQRHEQLAEQLAKIEQDARQRAESVVSLSDRRKDLQELIRTLAEREAHHGAGRQSGATDARAAATPSPGTQPASAPPSTAPQPDSSVAPTPLFESTPHASAGPLPSPAPELALQGKPGSEEIPYEAGSEPLMSQTANDQGAAAEQGTRRLFWRANPVDVRAAASGQVVFAQPFAGYRHLLILDHGNGWRSLYGNLTSSAVAEGQLIQVGQPIGKYQASQGAHAEPFWFEVRNGVSPVSPDNWSQLPTGWESRLFAEETVNSAAGATNNQ